MLFRLDGAPLTQQERLRIQRQTEDVGVIRAYRLLHLLSFLLLPIFWVAFTHVEPDAFDPLGVRLVLATASLLLFGLSYVSPWVRRHYVAFGHATVYLLTLWILIVTELNGFTPNYAIGYYFLVVVGCTAIGLSVTSVWPLVAYSISTLSITTAVMLSGPAPHIDTAVYFFSVLGTVIVLITAMHSRAQAFEALRSSEAHLSEAQRIAGLGNWEVNAITGMAWWSQTASDLFGWAEPAPTWADFEALLLPEERLSVQAWRTSDGALPFPRYLSVQLPDGGRRILEMRVRVILSESGSPQYVLGTCLNVTEQKLQERELIEAMENAERMNRLKDAFLANMSHEIRTPLTAVIGYAEVLSSEVGPGYEDLTEPIRSGGQRLLDTLNSVLDLARLEAGDQPLNLQPLEACQVVQEAVQLLSQIAATKGLRLKASVPAVPTFMIADASALNRILHNLIGNAIKFTERGTVNVRLHRGEEHVIISVEDTGVGISEAFLPRLFDEFQQESTGHSRSHEGCGLGLTLTKRMTEAMGGSISVSSSLGAGSTFSVRLPAAPCTPALPMPPTSGLLDDFATADLTP